MGTDSEKQNMYINNYFLKEGVCLDRSNIQANPGLHSLAKRMLIHSGGNLVSSITWRVHFERSQDDSQNIDCVQIINDEMIKLYRTFKEECDEVQTDVNIFVACFTTSHAHLKLLKTLDLFGERVIYFDTDSLVYTWYPGQSQAPCWNFLGDYTSQLAEGDFIQEWTNEDNEYVLHFEVITGSRWNQGP